MLDKQLLLRNMKTIKSSNIKLSKSLLFYLEDFFKGQLKEFYFMFTEEPTEQNKEILCFILEALVSINNLKK